MSWGIIVSQDHTQRDRQREGWMKRGRLWKSEAKKGGEEEGDRWREKDEGKFLLTPYIKSL